MVAGGWICRMVHGARKLAPDRTKRTSSSARWSRSRAS